jgi:hydrogenase maturation protein HypF
LLVLDWEPLIRGLLDGVARRESRALLSARFHATLAELCREVAERRGTPEIVLSGGCFQNQELASRVERALSARGYRAFLPSEFPCNDGGLSLGQAWIVTLRHLEKNDVPRDPR